MCFGGKFKIGPFDNGIDGAGLLALLLVVDELIYLCVCVCVRGYWIDSIVDVNASVEIGGGGGGGGGDGGGGGGSVETVRCAINEVHPDEK